MMSLFAKCTVTTHDGHEFAENVPISLEACHRGGSGVRLEVSDYFARREVAVSHCEIHRLEE